MRLPIELYDTITNEQIFGNVPLNLNKFPTSAIIGYVTIHDIIKGEIISAWGSQEYQWIIDEAYLFDEPQPLETPTQPDLFDIPGIDEDHLPPAHKVNLKGMKIEGKVLHVDITDTDLEVVLETGDFKLGYYAGDSYFVLEDENGFVDFEQVLFKSPSKEISLKKKEIQALCYLENDGKHKQVPSILAQSNVDWNVYSIQVEIPQ